MEKIIRIKETKAKSASIEELVKELDRIPKVTGVSSFEGEIKGKKYYDLKVSIEGDSNSIDMTEIYSTICNRGYSLQ